MERIARLKAHCLRAREYIIRAFWWLAWASIVSFPAVMFAAYEGRHPGMVFKIGIIFFVIGLLVRLAWWEWRTSRKVP